MIVYRTGHYRGLIEEIEVEKETRLQTKISCYRTFITELNRELKKDNNE